MQKKRTLILKIFFWEKAEAYAEEFNNCVSPEYHIKYVGGKYISEQEIDSILRDFYIFDDENNFI